MFYKDQIWGLPDADIDRYMDSLSLRKQTVETLALLVERYPNLPIGRIIAGALVGDVYDVTDVDLARGLNQLFITYTQFEAAGIKP